jgi:thiol-disulfide isomerase/thioredoxin
MKNLSYTFFMVIAFLSLSACDKIENPYENIPTNIDTGDGNNNKPDTVIKKIIIEDFTGHTCGNCPKASATAIQLQSIYGKKLIVVAIHSGHFAATQTNSNGSFSTNFKTAAGDAYNDFWKVDQFGNPNGLVNRSKILENKIIVGPTAWGTAIEAIKNNLPDVKLSVTLNYDEANRMLSTTVSSKAINNISGKYNLVLYLVEDKIVDWQKDYSLSNVNVPDYVHRHVLRDNINNIWGDEIITSTLLKGDSVVKTYNNYNLNPNWKANDCSVVAYIRNTETHEIIQVEEVYLKK